MKKIIIIILLFLTALINLKSEVLNFNYGLSLCLLQKTGLPATQVIAACSDQTDTNKFYYKIGNIDSSSGDISWEPWISGTLQLASDGENESSNVSLFFNNSKFELSSIDNIVMISVPATSVGGGSVFFGSKYTVGKIMQSQKGSYYIQFYGFHTSSNKECIPEDFCNIKIFKSGANIYALKFFQTGYGSDRKIAYSVGVLNDLYSSFQWSAVHYLNSVNTQQHFPSFYVQQNEDSPAVVEANFAVNNSGKKLIEANYGRIDLQSMDIVWSATGTLDDFYGKQLDDFSNISLCGTPEDDSDFDIFYIMPDDKYGCKQVFKQSLCIDVDDIKFKESPVQLSTVNDYALIPAFVSEGDLLIGSYVNYNSIDCKGYVYVNGNEKEIDSQMCTLVLPGILIS